MNSHDKIHLRFNDWWDTLGKDDPDGILYDIANEAWAARTDAVRFMQELCTEAHGMIEEQANFREDFLAQIKQVLEDWDFDHSVSEGAIRSLRRVYEGHDKIEDREIAVNKKIEETMPG